MPAMVETHERRTLYRSEQSPSYTAWAGLYRVPGQGVMACFIEATGPGPRDWRPRAPEAVRRRLAWPPAGHNENYDMTGLVLRNVHLRSSDRGKTWHKVSADPFTTCMNGVTGQAETALESGVILRGVWGHYLPYWDVPQTGHIQRSLDGAESWGEPEVLCPDPGILALPKRIRVLHDGRIVVTGATVPRDPDNWTRDSLPYKSELRTCLWVSRDKEGSVWADPLYVLPEDRHVTEECDIAELDNGDLFFICRNQGHGPRLQCVLVKKGETWKPTAPAEAPFPHSGHPELLMTREGLVLYLAPDALWATADLGKRWSKLDAPGTGYYPRSVQLDDGTILVVSHAGGGDSPYGTDLSIVMDTYRLAVPR